MSWFLCRFPRSIKDIRDLKIQIQFRNRQYPDRSKTKARHQLVRSRGYLFLGGVGELNVCLAKPPPVTTSLVCPQVRMEENSSAVSYKTKSWRVSEVLYELLLQVIEQSLNYSYHSGLYSRHSFTWAKTNLFELRHILFHFLMSLWSDCFLNTSTHMDDYHWVPLYHEYHCMVTLLSCASVQ